MNALANDTIERELAIRRAEQHIRARFGLAMHGLVWGVALVLLIVLNVLVTPGFWWFWWPAGFWLIALAAHSLLVIGPAAERLEKWRETSIRRELERSLPSTKRSTE